MSSDVKENFHRKPLWIPGLAARSRNDDGIEVGSTRAAPVDIVTNGRRGGVVPLCGKDYAVVR